jgi:hypothetical protein
MILYEQRLPIGLKKRLACYRYPSLRMVLRNSRKRAFQLVGLVLLFILTIGAREAYAQTQSVDVVTGIVVDAQTGDTLPGATVQIESTYTGTISNESGVFAINVSSYPVRLIVRFIGY